MSASDQELITQTLVYDDRAAFSEIVLRYQLPVRRFLRSLLSGDATAADDLAQLTFLRAFEKLKHFRGEAKLQSWLLGIAHNEHRNARRKRREPNYGLTPAEVSPPGPDPVAKMSLQHDLDQAMTKLSCEERTAILLCFQHGLSHSEAAGVLACPLGTLKTHLARGKDRLRQSLTEWKTHVQSR